jgi:hypothetical protein
MIRLGRTLAEMLPKRSENGECAGKVQYTTHAEVKRMGRFLRRQGVRGLSAYRCRRCKAWHLGNTKTVKNT